MTHNLLILFVSSILAFLGSADAGGDFTDTWASKTTDVITFSLDLKQRGSRIKGYHNAVAPGGRRVDDVQPDSWAAIHQWGAFMAEWLISHLVAAMVTALAKRQSPSTGTSWIGKLPSRPGCITSRLHLFCIG